MNLWELFFGRKSPPPRKPIRPAPEPAPLPPIEEVPAGIPREDELSKLGPAAVERLLRAREDPQHIDSAAKMLAAIPAATTVEPLLHLLEDPRLGATAREMLLRLDKSILADTVKILLRQYSADSPAFALARRCLARLWPDVRDIIVGLAEGKGLLADRSRRYLATFDPEPLADLVRQRYPHWADVQQRLDRCRVAGDVLPQLFAGRPWLQAQARADADAVWLEYRGSIIIACLAATGHTAENGKSILADLSHSSATPGHVIQGLALPECRTRAREYLDTLWEREPRSFVALWWEEREPITQGLLENYLLDKGSCVLELFASLLDSGHHRPAAVSFLSWQGARVIPMLARKVGLAGYSKGLLDTIDPIVADMVNSVLVDLALVEDGCRCVGVTDFKAGEYSDGLRGMVSDPDFDPRDWQACLRRDRTGLAWFPDVLSLREAIHLCARWEVTPMSRRAEFARQIQTEVAGMLALHSTAYRQHLAEVQLCAQRLVAEPRGKWYVEVPALPHDVASRLTPLTQVKLRHARTFLRYIAQARVAGGLKDFAEEMLQLLP